MDTDTLWLIAAIFLLIYCLIKAIRKIFELQDIINDLDIWLLDLESKDIKISPRNVSEKLVKLKRRQYEQR